MKNWQNRAIELLAKSLNPVPVELNELDWKSGLSDKTKRLAQHISAFANHPDGGFMIFGIDNSILCKDKSNEVWEVCILA